MTLEQTIADCEARGWTVSLHGDTASVPITPDSRYWVATVGFPLPGDEPCRGHVAIGGAEDHADALRRTIRGVEAMLDGLRRWGEGATRGER